MRYTSLLLLICSLNLYGQDQFTVSLQPKGREQFFEKSKLIAPVFKLRNNVMESYQQFGVPDPPPSVSHRVKLPNLGGVRDTGYTFLYSAVDKNGYTGVVIANYSRMQQEAILFVDHNHNFDFTDDGKGDTFYLSMNFMDIPLRNHQDTLQKVFVRLSRFDFTSDLNYKKMADAFYQKYQGNKEYVGTELSFREQRFTVRRTDVFHEQDSFTLALIDGNFNGLFNEPGKDRIVVENYGTELVSQDRVFEIHENGPTWFERNFKSYQVTSIDPYGRQISYKTDDAREASRKLTEGKKVPKFRFQDHNDKTVKLKWYRNKPVYIYFWSRESPGFEEDTTYMRMIQEKYCPMIKVIALNYGDNPKLLSSYVEFNKVSWTNGLATKAIIDEYYVEQIPYGYLTGRRLRLRASGISPKQVWEMLEKGTIQQKKF